MLEHMLRNMVFIYASTREVRIALTVRKSFHVAHASEHDDESVIEQKKGIFLIDRAWGGTCSI